MSSSGFLGNATFHKPNSLSSLRRTLSAADMSASYSSCPVIKRAQSSTHLTVQDADHHHRHLEREVKNSDEKRGAIDDVWGSILSNKKNEFGSGAPYVHPLVKRTASSLSEKSLEICTESLGSETGSDGFGSLDPHQQPEFDDQLILNNGNLFPNSDNIITAFESETKECNYRRGGPPITTPTKSMVMSSASSFPPPLPSLSHSHQMRSRRHDGRLVLEAVYVPSTTTRLHALRSDGRLLLTLSSDPGDLYNNNYDMVDNTVHQGPYDNFSDDDGGDGDSDDQGKELALEFVMEQAWISSCRMIMSKVIGTQKWRPRNFNATVIKNLDEEEDEPLIPPTNAYEYYWKRSDVHCATVAVLKPVAGQPPQVVVKGINGNEKCLGCNTKKITGQAQQEKQKRVMVERAAGDEHLVPLLRGCKEPRRPRLPPKLYLIAT